MSVTRIFLTMAGLALLAGCAGSGADDQVIVDTQRDAAFQADLDECRQLARTNPRIDGNQRTDAAVLAGIGALIGAFEDGAQGAAVGGAIGGGVGLGGGALESQNDRSRIVRRCLAGRGYRVLN